jgi:hypothetical protein
MAYLLIATLMAEFSKSDPGARTRMAFAACPCESEILSTLKVFKSLVLLVWICATIDLKNSSRQTRIPF